jgi:hypothetical protein
VLNNILLAAATVGLRHALSLIREAMSGEVSVGPPFA